MILPPGYSIGIAAEGLLGPTQMIRGPDDWLWVAQLDGPENASQGEVLALSLETGERRILLENLLKPTGIAVLDGALWIAAERTLLRAPLIDAGGAVTVGEPETVLADLPYNGRSNGTLTVTPEGTLLYETSGRRRGNDAAAGSATLWELDPASPDDAYPLATGLKGAYAHTFDADGRLWTVEIGDDPVNGAPPPDELNLVVPGADFGWPRCFGQQEPARNYGGTAAFCAGTRAPVALFPPRSTPVSLVPSPWAEDVLLVALWLSDVVQVSVSQEGDNATGTVDPFLQGLGNPQHLLVWDENRLLVSDFRTGTIYLVQQSD